MKITNKQVSKAIKELGFDIDSKKDVVEFEYTRVSKSFQSDKHEIIIKIREDAKDGKLEYS